MKVAMVVFGDLDERSGGFLYDRKLAEELEASGDSVRVVSQRDGGLLRRLAGNGGLLRKAREADVDLVLIDELNHAATFRAVGLLKKSLALPVVAIVHHLRGEEELGPAARAVERAMERRFLRGVDALVCNSQATAAAARSLADIGEKPVIVAYPGKDRYEGSFRRARSPASPLRILFMGNLIPRKNLEGLIRAVAALRPGTWRLDVCGDHRPDPEYTARMAALARSVAGPESIRFHGRLDDRGAGALLAEADVLAVPSDLEGFGIVYLEAMRAGVVPVASARGGAAELVGDGVDGFLIGPHDDAGLARRLSELLENPDRLASMRDAALKRAEAFPTWKESMARIRAFLHEIRAGYPG